VADIRNKDCRCWKKQRCKKKGFDCEPNSPTGRWQCQEGKQCIKKFKGNCEPRVWGTCESSGQPTNMPTECMTYSPSSSPSIAATPTATVGCPPGQWCRRVLAEDVGKPRDEELTSFEDIQELVEEVNEDVDLAGIHYKKDGLLSKEECEALVRYFDDHTQLKASSDQFQKEDIYMEASAIAEVIGTEAFQGVLAFLFESVGKAPISSIILRRSFADGVTKVGMMPWHMHEKIPGFKESTVTVALDGDSMGGDLRFLTRDGVVTAPRQQGRGHAVPYNTLHAVDPYHGMRYSLNVHVNHEGSIKE